MGQKSTFGYNKIFTPLSHQEKEEKTQKTQEKEEKIKPQEIWQEAKSETSEVVGQFGDLLEDDEVVYY